MTMKTGNSFKNALDKVTKKNNFKPKTNRTRISKAVAMLNLEPDKAVEAVNAIVISKNKYETAVKILGHLRADKIKHMLDLKD